MNPYSKKKKHDNNPFKMDDFDNKAPTKPGEFVTSPSADYKHDLPIDLDSDSFKKQFKELSSMGQSMVGGGFGMVGDDSGGWDPAGDYMKKLSSMSDITGGSADAMRLISQRLGKEGLNKFATKLSGLVNKGANPLISLADAGKNLLDTGKTVTQKAGAVAQGASAIAATNFWNPAGWVAGALAIGGTLLQAFGGSKFKPGRFR